MRSNICWILLFISFSYVSTQFFNEEDEATNEDGPLYVPGKCGENQLLYKVSEDENVDRVCDCGPGFVYYGPKDACFEAYRQGPCKPREYLALMKPSNQVSCLRNPCNQDEMVPFKKRCYKLHSSSACPMKKEIKGTLGVNSTTLQINCIYGIAELNFITVNSCPPGSKRIATGQCRQPTAYN